jgi:hypothetical protein
MGAGQSKLNPHQFSQYKLADNVLYVNSSLTRAYFETKKAKAQRERLVGLARSGQRGRSELTDFSNRSIRMPGTKYLPRAPSGRVIDLKPVMPMVGGKTVYDTRRH